MSSGEGARAGRFDARRAQRLERLADEVAARVESVGWSQAAGEYRWRGEWWRGQAEEAVVRTLRLWDRLDERRGDRREGRR